MYKIIKAIFPVILLFSLSTHATDLGLRRRIYDRYYVAPQDEGEQTRLNKRQIVDDAECCAKACAIYSAQLWMNSQPVLKNGLGMLLVSPLMCTMASSMMSDGDAVASCMDTVNLYYTPSCQEACVKTTQNCACELAAFGCWKMVQKYC